MSLFSIICSMILTFHKHVLLKCILFPPLLYISVVSILLSTVRSSMSMLTKLLICSNSELSQTKVISSPTHKNFRPMLHVLASNHGSYGSIERSINDNSFLSKYFTDASSFFAWLNLMGHWNLNTKEVSSSTMGTNSRKMSQRSQSLQSYRKNYYRHKLNTTSEKEFFGI